MLDIVKLKVVFIVVVVPLIVVQIVLQLLFKGTILSFSSSHIAVLKRISGCPQSGDAALNQYRTGGKRVEQESQENGKQADDDKTLFVTGDKLCSFLGFLRRFLCGLCGGFRSLDRAARCMTGFCRHIFLLDGSLLLPPGIRIAGQLRVLITGFFVQGVDIGLVRLCLSLCRCAVRLELMGMVCRCNDPHTTLGGLLQTVSALNTHIFILRFPDLTMRCGKHGIDRSCLYSMRELGGRGLFINLFKMQMLRNLAIGINHKLLFLNGFLGDFCLGLVQLVRLLLRLMNCLFQFRCGLLFVRKLQPRRTLTHKASPPICRSQPDYSTLI